MIRLSVILLFLSLGSFAQNKFSAYLQGSSASQWVSDPASSSDVMAYSSRQGYGGGLRYDVSLNKYFSLSYRVNYSQKGFDSRSNKLDYLGLDNVIQFFPHLWNADGVYFFTGLRNDRLLKKSVDQPQTNPNNNQPINPNDYHRWSFGGLTGIGYWMNRLNLELGMNYDLAPSLRTDNTLVRNYLWFLNVGFQLF